MEAILSSGPQVQDNGTFMSTEEMLDGKQPQGLTALVVNKTLEKCSEMESQLRTTIMKDMGIGNRLDSEA